jgi:hypothetical protein
MGLRRHQGEEVRRESRAASVAPVMPEDPIRAPAAGHGGVWPRGGQRRARGEVDGDLEAEGGR